MGIVEGIIAITTAVSGIVALVRELRKGNKLTRGEIIGEAEKLAWHAVEVTKRMAAQRGRPLGKEEIWAEFQKEAWKYASGKGLKNFSKDELRGMRQTAELLSHVAKNGIDMVKGALLK